MSIRITCKNTFLECALVEEAPHDQSPTASLARSASLPSLPSPSQGAAPEPVFLSVNKDRRFDDTSTTGSEGGPGSRVGSPWNSQDNYDNSYCLPVSMADEHGQYYASPAQVGAKHNFDDVATAALNMVLAQCGVVSPSTAMKRGATPLSQVPPPDPQECVALAQVHALVGEALAPFGGTVSACYTGHHSWILSVPLGLGADIETAAQVIPHCLSMKPQRVQVLSIYREQSTPLAATASGTPVSPSALPKALKEQNYSAGSSVSVRLACFAFENDSKHHDTCWYWTNSGGTSCRYQHQCHWYHPPVLQINIRMSSYSAN